MRAAVRWIAAVAAAILVFEGLDALGSVPGSGTLAWLPAVSPALAGAVAAWIAGARARAALPAAVAAVWGRIGADRAYGMLQGARLPSEFGMVLLLAFGVPWTVMALAGGAVVLLARWIRRRTG